MRRVHEHHELVLAEHDRAELRFGRLEREHPEVEAALRDFGSDLARRNAADVNVNQRVSLAEPRDEVQDGVHRRLVGADEHAAAAQIAELTNRGFGLLRQPQEAVGVVPEEPSRVGQGGVLGRAVEQALADAFLQPADRLADRRLRAVELHGRPAKSYVRWQPSEKPAILSIPCRLSLISVDNSNRIIIILTAYGPVASTGRRPAFGYGGTDGTGTDFRHHPA